MAFKYSDYKRKLAELTESAAPARKQNPEWEKQKAQIKDMHRASLKDLSSQLDPHYQRSDDYSHFKKHDAIAQQINWLKKQIGESDDSVDEGEIDFGSIGKTLSKYGTGVPAGTPKKPSRSTVNPDYTMTGHREKTSSTGRVYSKVLTDYDDDSGKAAKATKQPDQVDAPKRGRGRPAGASNKDKSYKPWSDEARASLKAKLAAKKAAKAGVKNESEEHDNLENLDESFVVTDDKGQVVHTAYSQKSAQAKADALTKQTGTPHGVKFVRTAVVESAHKPELDEQDWADIVDDHTLDEIAEFMLDEDYTNLDELSKATLGSYIKKASRQSGVDKAVGKLTQESEEIDESVTLSCGEKHTTATNESELDPIVEFYANRLTSNLIKG